MVDLRTEETGTFAVSRSTTGGVFPEHPQQVRRVGYEQTKFRKTADTSGSYSPALHLFRPVDPVRVRQYIDQFPALTPILIEARKIIQKYFPDASTELSVVQDHESDQEQLFVYIYTVMPVEEAVSQLDALDNAWYLDNGESVNWKFNFNLRFGRV